MLNYLDIFTLNGRLLKMSKPRQVNLFVDGC